MKKIAAIILSAVMLLSLVSCERKNNEPNYNDPDNPIYGLTLGKGGKLLLNGEPVYAYGVNLFDVFVNKKMVDRDFDLETPFKSLHDSGIRVARICMGPFYESGFALYMNSPEQYFEALDAVVAAAEKYEVGIVASVCWNFTNLVDWVGEHVAYGLGNKESKTIALAKEYYTTVVERYKNSPAIWAWEFGNEYNLGADLKSMSNVVGTSMPGTVRTEEDYYTSWDVSVFYTEVGNAIRSIDPYRLIVGGDSELSCRPAALRNKDSWEADDYDDVVDSTKLYAPGSLGAVSSHFYHSNHKKGLPDYSDDEEDKIYDKWIKWGIDAAAEIGKGYYIGEYGPGEALNNGQGDDEIWRECVNHLQESFLKNGVQIALGWLCVNDFTTPDKLKGFYKDWYETLEQINADFKADGKQDNIDKYWANAKKSLDFDVIGMNCMDNFLGYGNPGVVLQLDSRETSYSNGWLGSDYNTNAEVSIVSETLADGTQGKVFRLSGSDASSKTLIKFSSVSNVHKGDTYKLSFYVKTENISGDGIKVKIGSPYILDESGIKSVSDGEWTLIELETSAPETNKTTYNMTVYFENQSGTAELYGFKLVKQ